MLEALQEIRGFVRGRSRKDLRGDRMLLLAVIKSIEILGEAANQVSEETKRRLPEVPWKEIVSMRNRLVHGYFTIDVDIVWETVQKDLPELFRVLRKVA
jgi:uncharacterized protein with HEPN domain